MSLQANHFPCIDMIIDHAKLALTEKIIKELHLILKNSTSDSRKEWVAVGDYKKMPNEVGGIETVLPEKVADNMKMFYYRGLKEWNNERGHLTDICLTAQDRYKAYLDYFRIEQK